MTGFGGTETVIANLFSEFNKSLNKSKYQLKLVSIGGYKDDSWLSEINKKKIIWLSSYKMIRKIQYLFLLPIILYTNVCNIKKNSILISTNPIMWFLLYRIKKIFSLKYKVVSWYHYSLDEKDVSPLFLKN